MKKLVAAVLVLLFVTSAFGQGGFELATPAQPLGDSLIVWDGHNGTTLVTVAGHWEDTPDLIHGLAGPSVSTISCDRSKAVCEEEHAFIKAMGNTFTVLATHLEYKVERWTDKEIVAEYVFKVCGVHEVLKFDLVQKKVFSRTTHSNEKLSNLCGVDLNLELKASTSWKK